VQIDGNMFNLRPVCCYRRGGSLDQRVGRKQTSVLLLACLPMITDFACAEPRDEAPSLLEGESLETSRLEMRSTPSIGHLPLSVSPSTLYPCHRLQSAWRG
jgi:hypothetical protein